MAFTSTKVKKYTMPGGMVREEGTWTSTGGTTTGNITADTTEQPEMRYISLWCASSNGDTAVNAARDAGLNVLKLTFTANDGGTYTIEGPAV